MCLNRKDPFCQEGTGMFVSCCACVWHFRSRAQLNEPQKKREAGVYIFIPLSVRNRGAQKAIMSEHTKYLCCCWGRSDPVRALQCPRSAAPDVKWCRESSPEGNVSGRRRRPGKNTLIWQLRH